MRTAIIGAVIGVASFFTGLALPAPAVPIAPAAHIQPAECNPATTECKPEHVLVRITNPDGTHVWISFEGTGSGGETPMREASWVSQLTANGFRLITKGCGSKADPCHITAELSPPS